jgi:hypothetical protein
VPRAEVAMDQALTVEAVEDGTEAVDRVPRSREQPGVHESGVGGEQQGGGRPLEGLPP